MTWNWLKNYDRTSLVLFVVLIGAFVLRIWGIWFGLPHIFHNDEGFEVVRALRLGTGDYDFERIGKGGYFYLLFVEYAILFITWLGFGIVESPAEFGEQFIRDPSTFYLIGRATTAVIGTATVYMVYRTGRIAYSGSAGLVAAVLLAVNILHADLSHYTTVDVPMTFLCAAALYFAIKIAHDGRTRNYAIAAALAALATSTKIPAVLVLIPLLIAHGTYMSRSGGTITQYLFNRQLWMSAAIFLGAYAITTPGILIYYDDVLQNALGKFFSGVETDSSIVAEGPDERALSAGTNRFIFYLDVLIKSMTWPIFGACMAGLAYAVWKRQPADVILASFSIVVFLAMASSTDTKQFYPRYMLPAIPCLALLGGRFLVDVVHKFRMQNSEGVLAVLVTALAVLPTAEISAANVLITAKDTRTEAKEWIEANIGQGARIFIEGHRTTLTKATVPLNNSAENLRESIEYYRGREPGKARYFKMALKVLSGRTYDLVGVSPEELQDLQYYKSAGIQYFVLRPAAYEGSRSKYEWPEFVEQIRRDPDIDLIRKFEPDPRKQPGPLIEIYRVSSNVEPDRVANSLNIWSIILSGGPCEPASSP